MSARRLPYVLLLTLTIFLTAAAAQEPAPAPDVDVQVFLLVASGDAPQGAKLPPRVEPLAREIEAATQLRGLRLAATFMHRVSPGGRAAASGLAGPLLPLPPSATHPTFYTLAMNPRPPQPAAGENVVRFTEFNFGLRIPLLTGPTSSPSVDYQNLGLNTALALRLDEPALVGTMATGRPGELFVLVALARRAA